MMNKLIKKLKLMLFGKRGFLKKQFILSFGDSTGYERDVQHDIVAEVKLIKKIGNYCEVKLKDAFDLKSNKMNYFFQNMIVLVDESEIEWYD